MTKRKQISDVITDFLNKNATWNTNLILIGLILFFNLVLFPLVYKPIEITIPLDLQFSYSPEKAYTLLEKYNQKELRQYVIGELTVDFIYPIVYTLFLVFLIFKLSKKKTLSLFPLLILFLDYFENIGIVTLIIQLPQNLPNLVMLTSLFTSLKWILIAITIVLIFTLVIVKFYNQRAKN